MHVQLNQTYSNLAHREIGSELNYLAISLTNWCPVQCQFCFMNAVPKRRDEICPSNVVIDNILNFFETRQVTTLSIGGGEPFLTTDSLLQLCQYANVATIELFTSGLFAESKLSAQKMLNQLSLAICGKTTRTGDIRSISLMLSIDVYHKKVSSENIVNIIEAWLELDQNYQTAIQLTLKGVSTADDPIQDICINQGWQYKKSGKGFVIYFPNFDITVPVSYSTVKLQYHHVGSQVENTSFLKLSSDDLFNAEPLMDTSGLRMSVSHNGTISLNEYLVDAIVLGNADDPLGLERAEARLRYDKLISYLRSASLADIYRKATELDSKVAEDALRCNNKYLLISNIYRNESLSFSLANELGLNKNHHYIPAVRLRIPHRINTITRFVVEVTNQCPVQCSFCWVDAVPKQKDAQVMNERTIEAIIAASRTIGVRQFDITGGEPLLEPELVLRFVRETAANFVTISTSGKLNQLTPTEFLKSLQKTIFSLEGSIIVEIRLSVDEFHWHVSKNILISWLDAFENLNIQAIRFQIRNMATKNDPTINYLQKLGFKVSVAEIHDHGLPIYKCERGNFIFTIKTQELRLTPRLMSNGFTKTVTFANTVQDRIVRSARIGTETGEDGYCFITPNGNTSPHAFLSKEISISNICDRDFRYAFFDVLEYDPIFVMLRLQGIGIIYSVLESIAPELTEKAYVSNNIYQIVIGAVSNPKIHFLLSMELRKMLEGL